MLNFLFAHAGEMHESSIQATAHEIPWYVQIPLFILVIAVIALGVYTFTKKLDLVLLITSTVLLVSGFFFFSVAPAISVISITVGLVTTLLVTLLGLGSK